MEPAMQHPVLDGIDRRFSANLYDPDHRLADSEISRLIAYATRAPSAYNLQNWRFIAVRSAQAKARLRALAYDQPKVTEAAVTIIIIGLLPDAAVVSSRLSPMVESGAMNPSIAQRWEEGARSLYAHPQTARDEAIRSGTLAAATLMAAAQAMGLATGPMVGFDPDGVRRAFGLVGDDVPVMLVTLGRAADGNWSQKPRRPTNEVLEFA